MLRPDVIHLDRTYRDLGRPWTHDELAIRYTAANRHGEQLLSESPDMAPGRPIALLATAIPSLATANVAIHLLHALPPGMQGKLARELLDTAETNAADALHRCHRALELDGLSHGYTAEEWLPIVCDMAGPLLQAARLENQAPTVVQAAHEAISWLSRSVIELDADSAEAPTALAETLARLLMISVFAAFAGAASAPG